MKRIQKLLGAAVIATASTGAAAQYPNRPITIVVPFAAGGPSDAVARTLGRALSQSLGQPVVVENKPGAEGLIAAQAVYNAPADGYTLVLTGSSISAGLPAIRKDLPIDPRALTPVANVARLTFAVYVNPQIPARTVEELVGHARARPGQLNYAVAASSEHMAIAQLLKATGTDMVKVPYRGSAQAIPELLAGRVQVYVAPLTPERIAYSKDGRLRMLAIAAPARSPYAQDVPTTAEAGYATVVVPGWNAIVGPPKLPAPIVQKLAAEIGKVLQDAEVRSQYERLAMEASSSTPEALRAMIESDFRAWSEFARENALAAN